MKLNWQKTAGLLPAIIQNADDGTVLMLGYMNQAALDKTLETGMVTFFSRTKQRLWTKGETSGNTLSVVSIYPDCDRDALLIQVSPAGPTCHLGNQSCFVGQTQTSWQVLTQLQRCIQDRQANDDENSYTKQLLNSNLSRIAQKVGEEGVEVALTAMGPSSDALANEAADLVYHLVVLLVAKNLDLQSVMTVLQRRQK